MIFKKQTRFKPLFKQFKKLNDNIQNRKKILQFKKQKWVKLLGYLSHKNKRYKKFKPFSQNQYTVSRYSNKWNSYKKGTFRIMLYTYKKFRLLYGNFTKYKMKNFLKQTLLKNHKKTCINTAFLKIFERRLDTILYRAKFSKSIRAARQLIVHGKILVNGKKIKSQSIFLKEGDLISVYSKAKRLIGKNIANSIIWPIPPKHLIINYKTLQIILGSLDNINFSSYFSFSLNLEKLIIDFNNIK
jgi:small subunit ribosomal protein S4